MRYGGEVTPVGSLKWRGGEVGTGDETGPVTKQVRQALVDIQYGRAEDTFGWMPRRLTIRVTHVLDDSRRLRDRAREAHDPGARSSAESPPAATRMPGELSRSPAAVLEAAGRSSSVGTASTAARVGKARTARRQLSAGRSAPT